MLLNYLFAYHREDLINIVQHEDDYYHFSVNIKFDRMLQENAIIANKLLREFDELTTECNVSAIEAQKIIIKQLAEDNLTVKSNIHIRLYNFPPCPELVRTVLPKSKDVGLFLELSGTIVRTTAVKLLEFQRQYRCAKCKNTVTVKADFEQYYSISPPTKCSDSECRSNNFITVGGLERSNSKDYQEIKIQEQLSQLTAGLLPNSLWIILEDDLVDICKPGDNVTVCGIIRRRWKIPSTAGKRIEVEIVILANHIYVNNDTNSVTIITPEIKQYFSLFWNEFKYDPLRGRDIIVNSFCPQVYGLHIIKLAIMVILAGGSQFNRFNDSGVKIRSEPHLLLVGDPGTGKSQLLKFAAKVVSRSVLTTGIGSTSAGLTVSAVNENGEWQLEAGALVLSDGGVCCIDEFNSMKEHDRTSIHEAMEQQSISVAKASIVCKLNTRCSIIAATNPKGHLDPTEPLAINIGLSSPLLSRFDLLFILKDTIDTDWDHLVADYILNGSSGNQDSKPVWEMQTLQAYIIYIKKIQPKLTNVAQKILSTYYQFQRKSVCRNKARTTVRLLDSLVRLSQGHARLMCHSEVEILDAVTTVVLVEASMHGNSSILGLDFDMRSSSPENSAESCSQLIRTVLTKLKLFDLLEHVNLKQNEQCVSHSQIKDVNRTSKTSINDEIRDKNFEVLSNSNKKLKLDVSSFENFNEAVRSTSTQNTFKKYSEEENITITAMEKRITKLEILENITNKNTPNEINTDTLNNANVLTSKVLRKKSERFFDQFRFKPKIDKFSRKKMETSELDVSIKETNCFNKINLNTPKIETIKKNNESQINSNTSNMCQSIFDEVQDYKDSDLEI